MKILKEFIQFVKKPTEFFSEKLSSWEKLKMVVTLLLFEYLFIFAVVYPIELLIDKYVITTKESLEDWGVVSIVLGLIVFAPLFEEFIFRLPLRYSRNYIFQLFGKRMQQFWEKHYAFFFYAFAIAFGLIHIFNYSNTEVLFYCIAPLVVISQISGGVILGYIRLKAGFFWGVLYHGLFNGIVFIIGLCFYHNVETISYSDNEITKFSLHELDFIDKNTQQSEILRDATENITAIHFNDMSFNEVMAIIGIDKKLKGSDTWIDLDID